MKIDEVIAGGPFDNASSKVKKGCIIEKINGQEISADTDFYALLAGLTGEKVLISLSNGGKQWDEVVKPISDGACGALLYRRWIKQRAATWTAGQTAAWDTYISNQWTTTVSVQCTLTCLVNTTRRRAS